MLNRFTTPLVALGLLMAAPSVQAQEPSDYPPGVGYGAPAQGIEVPTSVNVRDSQRVLQVTQQPSQPTMRVVGDVNALPPEVQNALGVGAGEEAHSGMVNNTVTGLEVGRQPAATGWIDGADVYRGVIPGDRDSLPHISRTQQHGQSGVANTLSWIGFQPLDGVTRVFLQTGRPAQYQVSEGPDGLSLTIRLRDTRIELSNFRRRIDARYFDRAVSEIEAFRRGDGVTEVVIQLAHAATFTVEGAGDYLYVDFAE